jgi:hypothetical protein
MKVEQAEIRIAGKTLYVPSAEIQGRTVVVTGGLLRTAAVKDEELVEDQILEDPRTFVGQLKDSGLRADLFTFGQKLPETTPKYHYHFEWDNWAAMPITTFNDWWKKLPQETRKNVRRATKRGLAVKKVEFTDELVKGIHEIYNESPIRQGTRFRHFGKDFKTIKHEMSTYLERSDFLATYLNEDLVGFLKIVYVDQVAKIIHIVSKLAHQDKRPMNALIAEAVKVCENRKIDFLVYCKYVYFGNSDSSLTEFKRRNGFEEVRFPRYYVPLNAKGGLAIQSGLHKGLKSLIPAPMMNMLRDVRSRLYRRRSGSPEPLSEAAGTTS